MQNMALSHFILMRGVFIHLAHGQVRILEAYSSKKKRKINNNCVIIPHSGGVHCSGVPKTTLRCNDLLGGGMELGQAVTLRVIVY